MGNWKAAHLFDGDVGNYAFSQDCRVAVGHIYYGGGLSAGARAPIDYQVDFAIELFGGFLGGHGIWAAGNVGAGAGNGGGEGGGELPGDRVIGDSDGNGCAPAIDEAGDVRPATYHEGQGAGPECFGENSCEALGLFGDEGQVVGGGKEKGDGLGIGSALGVVEFADGGVDEGMSAETVEGVGREGDEAAALKNGDSLFDVGCAGS